MELLTSVPHGVINNYIEVVSKCIITKLVLVKKKVCQLLLVQVLMNFYFEL